MKTDRNFNIHSTQEVELKNRARDYPKLKVFDEEDRSSALIFPVVMNLQNQNSRPSQNRYANDLENIKQRQSLENELM